MYGVIHSGWLILLETAFWRVESPEHLLQVDVSSLHLVFSSRLASSKLTPFIKVCHFHANDDFESTDYQYHFYRWWLEDGYSGAMH